MLHLVEVGLNEPRLRPFMLRNRRTQIDAVVAVGKERFQALALAIQGARSVGAHSGVERLASV